MENVFNIYTDGACNNLAKPHWGGWGYVIVEDGVAIHEDSGAEKNTTNNRMELTAIINSFTELPPRSEVHIYTDSQYCITVLDGDKPRYPKNMDLIELFRKTVASGGYDVIFHWVKGHNGNSFNEFADKLANGAYERASGEKMPSSLAKKILGQPLSKSEKEILQKKVEELIGVVNAMTEERNYWRDKCEKLEKEKGI